MHFILECSTWQQKFKLKYWRSLKSARLLLTTWPHKNTAENVFADSVLKWCKYPLPFCRSLKDWHHLTCSETETFGAPGGSEVPVQLPALITARQHARSEDKLLAAASQFLSFFFLLNFDSVAAGFLSTTWWRQRCDKPQLVIRLLCVVSTEGKFRWCGRCLFVAWTYHMSVSMRISQFCSYIQHFINLKKYLMTLFCQKTTSSVRKNTGHNTHIRVTSDFICIAAEVQH